MVNSVGEKKYFAAANTGWGFKSFFNDIFYDENISKRYIIKGGPGTGKSSLMRHVAEAAEKSGHDVEYYYCSSDTDSLDGIVIGGSTALLDGTAPHTCDAVFPAVRDCIVNLGEHWNAERLLKAEKELTELNARKKKAYARAYSCLRTAHEAEKAASSLRDEFVLNEKLQRTAERICSNITSKRGTGKSLIKQTCALGTHGYRHFDTLSGGSMVKYHIDDCYGLSGVMLEYILSCAKSNGVQCSVSVSPIDGSTPTELYFPEKKIWLGTAEEDESNGEAEVRRLNMRRFSDNAKVAENRRTYRAFIRMRNDACALALEALSDAGKAHGELEKYYTASMDFSRVAELEEHIVKELGL